MLSDESGLTIKKNKSVCCRTESKVWSPLVNEEGKTHPYKMNLASQPQVSNGASACSSSHLLLSYFRAVSGLILQGTERVSLRWSHWGERVPHTS